MKKLFFIIPLGISIATMACSGSTEKSSYDETVTVQQTKTIKEDVTVEKFAALMAKNESQIVDVRTPGEWAEGTIKNAAKINFYDENFKSQLNKLDKEKPVYVYCKSGGRSGKAAKQMEEMGFKKVYNLIGGMDAWKGAGKETVK